jgi:opacity protein-like surface antigen
MRRILLGTLAALILTLPAAATTSDFGIFGAFTKPNDADNAWGGGAKVRFGFFELRGTYFTNITARESNNSCPPFCSNDKPRVRFTPLEAGLVYKFNDEAKETLSPFIGGGAGYYLLHESQPQFGRLDNQWGYYGVVGTDVNFTPQIALMLEANYRRVRGTIRGDSIDNITLNEGTHLQLGGPGFNAGVVWHF